MRIEEGRQEWRKIKGNRGKSGKIEKVDGRGGKEAKMSSGSSVLNFISTNLTTENLF